MQKNLALFAIIFAGEIIFGLPFHVVRFFKPQFLEAFQLNNAQVGDMFAMYGIVAMVSYFPGGFIADKFRYKNLMAFSLCLTSLGGFLLAFLPFNLDSFKLLYAFWGFTTICLFWAAMIKATRIWGDHNKQGLAFGLLDGGRGLVASIVASIGIVIFKWNSSLDTILLLYSTLPLVAAVLVLLFCSEDNKAAEPSSNISFDEFKDLILNKSNASIALIVVTAYCGYKALDNYGLYAFEVLKLSKIESSQFTTAISYTRPFVALIAGLLADKFVASRTVLVAFITMAACYFLQSTLKVESTGVWLITLNLLITVIAVFSLRAIYFSLFEESGLQVERTGVAVGVVSVVGYTPDIFFAPITGRILDANPGMLGFQHYFLFLTMTSVVGLSFSLYFIKSLRKIN